MGREKIYQLTIVLLILIIFVMGFYSYTNIVSSPIAKIGNQKITESDFNSELKRLYGKEVLDEMINKKVIYMIANENNISASQEEINRQYNELREGYDTEADFVEYLNDQMGWTKEQLLKNIEFYILWEEIATKDVVIDDDQINDYYEGNKELYTSPEMYHIEQIVVETEEEAKQVYAELNNGSDFNTLAKERSIDFLTANSGGDLGYVPIYDNTNPVILEAAKKLNINEISTPLKTDAGYAVIRTIEHKESSLIPLEDVKEEIRREIALVQVDPLTEILRHLKEDVGVEIYDTDLE